MKEIIVAMIKYIGVFIIKVRPILQQLCGRDKPALKGMSQTAVGGKTFEGSPPERPGGSTRVGLIHGQQKRGGQARCTAYHSMFV